MNMPFLLGVSDFPLCISSAVPFLNRVNVSMQQPELFSVVLARRQDEVMSCQTQSSLHGGHEGSVEDHPVHTRGFDQLSKLHNVLRGTRNLRESMEEETPMNTVMQTTSHYIRFLIILLFAFIYN